MTDSWEETAVSPATGSGRASTSRAGSSQVAIMAVPQVSEAPVQISIRFHLAESKRLIPHLRDQSGWSGSLQIGPGPGQLRAEARRAGRHATPLPCHRRTAHGRPPGSTPSILGGRDLEGRRIGNRDWSGFSHCGNIVGAGDHGDHHGQPGNKDKRPRDRLHGEMAQSSSSSSRARRPRGNRLRPRGLQTRSRPRTRPRWPAAPAKH